MKRLCSLLLLLLVCSSAWANYNIVFWYLKGYASTLIIRDNHGNGPITLHNVSAGDPRPLTMPGELKLPISYTVTMSDDHYPNVSPITSTSQSMSDPNCTGLGVDYAAHPQWASGRASLVCSCPINGSSGNGQCRVLEITPKVKVYAKMAASN